MVTKLLERAIEIEGLLRIIRDGKPLPETYSLLSAKAVALAEDCVQLEENCDNAHNEEEHAHKKMPEIVIVDTPISHKKEEQPAVPLHEELSDADLSLEEDEDDILLTIEDHAEELTEIHDKKSQQEDVPFLKEDTPFLKIEEKEDSKESEIQMMKSENEEIAKPAFKRQTKLKSAFSLNDRFLYSRELFDGNMKMFDSTLDFIEGIEEFSIIEDYFYSELEWDPESMAVASFMEILRPHFRE